MNKQLHFKNHLHFEAATLVIGASEIFKIVKAETLENGLLRPKFISLEEKVETLCFRISLCTIYSLNHQGNENFKIGCAETLENGLLRPKFIYK